MNKLRILFVCLLVLAGCDSGTKQLQVETAYMKAMPPGQKMAAIYMVIKNPTEKDFVINTVETPVANMAHVHTVVHEDGMMKMRPADHLRIARGSTLIFEPGGYHLMLMGVSDVLDKGKTFSVTMGFDGGETLVFPVEVR